MSKVFRDAADVTTFVGLQYIWIGSLCIIQDSTEDWSVESTQMSDIYSHGYLNIAADGFADGTSSLFTSRNVELLSPIKVVCNEDVRMHINRGDTAPLEAGEYLLLDVHSWKDEVEDTPLGRRAWVVQERALSPRTLHFGTGQVFWECLDTQASEIFPLGFVEGTVMNRLKEFPTFRINKFQPGMRIFELLKKDDVEENWGHRMFGKSRNQPLTLKERLLHWSQLIGIDPELLGEICLQDRDDVQRKLLEWNNMRSPQNLTSSTVKYMSTAHWKWCPVVEAYTACSLTFRKDKLIAIACMAQIIYGEMQCDYLAGLWRKDLEHQLLWKVAKRAPAVAISEVAAPSWSWASVDGTVEYDYWIGPFNGGFNPTDQAPADLGAADMEVEWLARTVKVDVQLRGHTLFGQVLGGTLVLAGQLGVMRITNGVTEAPTDTNGRITTTLNPEILWDDDEIHSRSSLGENTYTAVWKYANYGAEPHATHLHDVFYMPLRIMYHNACNFDYDMPMLQGLLLLPQAGSKGRYRRVGVFTVSEQWRSGNNDIIALRAATDVMDARYPAEKQEQGEHMVVIN